ncbi:hypothetical protein PInf_018103 [Phytophthora infestans]|nr:hypothetical protein PInf_018103 [Phytophthora infestans]
MNTISFLCLAFRMMNSGFQVLDEAASTLALEQALAFADACDVGSDDERTVTGDQELEALLDDVQTSDFFAPDTSLDLMMQMPDALKPLQTAHQPLGEFTGLMIGTDASATESDTSLESALAVLTTHCDVSTSDSSSDDAKSGNKGAPSIGYRAKMPKKMKRARAASPTRTAKDFAAANAAIAAAAAGADGQQTDVKKPTKKRIRRQREELLYLRVKVQEMESSLAELKSKEVRNKSPNGSSTQLAVNGKKAHHCSLRMEILLQKRARQQVSGCAEVVGVSGDLSSQGCTLDFLVDKDTYEALLTSVETAFAELEAVFATNGLLNLDTPCRDARMREGASGMYLDVFANKVLPFTYEAVTTAVWNHFKGSEKHRGVVYENATKQLETFSDTIMEAFTMEFIGKTTTADFSVKQVIRRFVETDRQVVVWVSIGHALDPNNSQFSSFGFVDKGYVVTRRPTSIAQGHGYFTILQMCSLVSPQMAAGCRIDMTAAGDFTEFVLNVVAANTTTSQELIENVLLDQELNKRPIETAMSFAA